MRAINTQVCILGSGPAGATASLYLSRYGIDHVIVDRGTFPRDKVCGELFDGRVERILTDLIPTARRELTARACLHETWRNDIHARSAHLPLHFSRKNLGKWIIPRTELDAYLAEKVRASKYATVLHGQNVQSVLTEQDGVRIQGPELRIRAELLLQACGAQSHFTPHDKDDLLLCARQYHRGLAGSDDKAVSFYFFRKPVLGCLMLSPLPTGKWLVEIGVTKKDFRKGKLSFGQILTAYLEQDRALRRRFARATPLEKMKGTFMPID